MDKIWHILCCGCCNSADDKTPQTKTQKLRNLKTLEQITPETEKSNLWSKTKSPLEVKTQDMSDIYHIPGQYSNEKVVLQTLGYEPGPYIDRGSFGAVYEARHIQTGLRIAIKEISIPEPLTKEMKKERLQLLADVKNELYTLQKLRHPHVVRMIQHFMVIQNKRQMSLHILMQLAEGGTLSKMSETRGPFNEPKCKIWFAQMLSALSYMHREGIAHRDLKQSNVLMDGTEECLITDFGLSRLVWRHSQDRILMSQTYCGTPPYIAPEVLALKKNSDLTYNAFLADVWALGVILFKLFDNNYPFSKRTTKALHNMHLKKWHYSKGRQPSAALKDIIGKMFVPDPQNRTNMESLKSEKWIKDVFITVEEKSLQKLKQMNN